MESTRPDPDFSCAGMSFKEWEQGRLEDVLQEIGDELNAALFGIAPKQAQKAKRGRP